ncbi:MAG TPA: type 1 glutamine amidotransferase [Beijerinckiaceae bacterium]
MPLRILVIDGNPREGREQHRQAYGRDSSEGYALLLRQLDPTVDCTIVTPADEGSSLPQGDDLSGYDGAVLTGSQLHMEEMSPPIIRQLDLMRAVFKAGVPAFGSCWGVQVAGTVAGGEVKRNPNGPEYGFARRLSPTAEGSGHPLLEGRPGAYDAPAIHLDAVVTPPPDARILASNGVLALQATEIRHEGGVFWGVQYHPEHNLHELAVMLESFAHELVEEKLVANEDAVKTYAADLKALHAAPDRTDLAWRFGIDAEVIDPARRTREVRNFLTHLVRPTKSARGRT